MVRKELKALSLERGVPVAISLPRSKDLLVLLVACFLEERPWILLHPEWPLERQQSLTRTALAGALVSSSGANPFCSLSASFDKLEGSALPNDKIAYLATSSGSTGIPKVAMLPRVGLMELMKAQSLAFSIEAAKRVAVVTNPGFDSFIAECFVSLWSGAEISFVPGLSSNAILNLEKMLLEQRVDILSLTPSLAAVLRPDALRNLETLVLMGESAPKKLIEALVNDIRLINAYGPCESSVCSHFKVLEADSPSNSIGFPLPHIKEVIKDGELVLSGSAVAYGYLGYPNERFENLQSIEGRIFYTGDLVERTQNGELLFKGRADGVTKLRGEKISLNDIQEQVLECEGVKQCVTFLHPERMLCLFYVGDKCERLLREELKERLSSASYPNVLTRLDVLPINSSGKVDLTLIKDQQIDEGPGSNLKISTQIWKEVLGVVPSDESEDFFDAGGDSLMVISVFSKFEELTGQNLDMDLFLKAPTPLTLEELAKDEKELSPPETLFERDLEEVKKLQFDRQSKGELTTILLTGATGRVGKSILKQLLDLNLENIYCLAREKSIPQSAQKNVVWLAQDLSETLSDEVRSLRDKVDLVIHCGAHVNHILPLRDLYNTNVTGTRRLLEWCENSSVQRFVYLGALSSQEIGASATGYDQSKWAAEKLVNQAVCNGLRASTMRLPLLLDSQVESNKDHFLSRIRHCEEFRSFPKSSEKLPLLDTEEAVAALLTLSFRVGELEAQYDFVNPAALDWNAFCERHFGAQSIDYDTWKTNISKGSLAQFADLYEGSGPFSQAPFPKVVENCVAQRNFTKNEFRFKTSEEVLDACLENKDGNVDIWFEAVKSDPREYEVERETLTKALSMNRMSELDLRKNCTIGEAWERQPQRFFFFKINGFEYVGQKLLSPIVTEHGSPGFFCSLIKPEMLLGSCQRIQCSQEGVEITFDQLSASERKSVFQSLLDDPSIDIYFPFNQMGINHRREVCTPDEGWFVTEERAQILGLGESHLRDISARLVASSALENPVVYDPACSTGEFLAYVKGKNPNAKVIGQDLSKEMIELARKKIEHAYVGNSLDPRVPAESCDFVFFRFLNSEVVNTSLAKSLFDSIITRLKSGGTAVLFGHTPVLITRALMEESGFDVLSCHAALDNRSAVFQYYVIRKRGV